MALTLPQEFKLSVAQKRNMGETLEAIKIMEERLQKMRNANIDVTEHESKLRDLKGKAEGILREFG